MATSIPTNEIEQPNNQTSMSMIQCPECNSEISNTASKCNNCGFPLQANSDTDPHKLWTKRPDKPASNRVDRLNTTQKIFILLFVANLSFAPFIANEISDEVEATFLIIGPAMILALGAYLFKTPKN